MEIASSTEASQSDRGVFARASAASMGAHGCLTQYNAWQWGAEEGDPGGGAIELPGPMRPHPTQDMGGAMERRDWAYANVTMPKLHPKSAQIHSSGEPLHPVHRSDTP